VSTEQTGRRRSPVDFTPRLGQRITIDVFFEAWRGWEAGGCRPDASSGEADTTVSLAVVQFREGSVTPMEVSGVFEQDEQRVVTDDLALPR
jgi:hypothetical protein